MTHDSKSVEKYMNMISLGSQNLGQWLKNHKG